MSRLDFFGKLYQFCEGKIEIRPLPGTPSFFDTTDMAGIDECCRKNEKSNLYFGVATRDGKGGKKENIVHIPCVWNDVDFKSTPRDIALEKLSKFPFKPSAIIKTGGGVHLYWFLKEPALQSEITLIEDIVLRIADQLGGDHNAHDASRILRIPGTINRKPEYDPSPMCEVSRIGDYYYNLEDFLEILPAPLDNKKTENKVRIDDTNWLASAMSGVSESNRNTTGTKIAGYFINKLPPHDVLTILKTWNKNNDPPLNDQELNIIIKSVSRYQSDIADKKRVDISNVYDAQKMIDTYREYVKTLKHNRFLTGIKQIDKQIRGVAGGEVLTVIARSGSFKTAFLQNMLKNYVQVSSSGAAFFSIEMPIASLTERYLEMIDGCTGEEIESQFLNPNMSDIQDLSSKAFLKELKNFYSIPTKVSLGDIVSYVRLIETEYDVKIGAIGIDYLGLMEGPGTNEYEIISRLSTGLKSIAKLINIPVVLLAQVSRKGASGEKEISLDYGRGSGAIEESADFVLGLWQVKNEDDKKDLICKILKNRKGSTGTCWKLDLVAYALHIGKEAELWKPPEKKCNGF